MTLGVFQPYFLPYIGYWQLMAAVDRFVIYDNIEYTKKSWINRNRFLQNGEAAYFTVPLKKGSDFLMVAERQLADEFDREKLVRTLWASYRKAPHFAAVAPVIERIIQAPLDNLYEYVHHSLVEIARYLEIATPLVVSSTIAIDHSLRSEQKVIALCQAMGADRYVNPVGGRGLYTAQTFAAQSIQLAFMEPRPISYPQFGDPFVANLSILDVLMFNSQPAVRALLREADVVPAV